MSGENGKKILDSGDNTFDKIEIDPEEFKMLIFTSGTTSKSKGVMICNRNLAENVNAVSPYVYLDENDRWFSVLPLHHCYECSIGFLLPMATGASVAICEGLRYITSNMLEYHPSVILCVPLLLEKMYQKIMKSIQKTLPKKYTENLSAARMSASFECRIRVAPTSSHRL